jgi:hypothetical protein
VGRVILNINGKTFEVKTTVEIEYLTKAQEIIIELLKKIEENTRK